jgi:hypothetical protein
MSKGGGSKAKQRANAIGMHDKSKSLPPLILHATYAKCYLLQP